MEVVKTRNPVKATSFIIISNIAPRFVFMKILIFPGSENWGDPEINNIILLITH